MKIFEFAVLYVPKKSEKKENNPKLIVPITTVLASDHTKANLLACRSIPEEYIDKLDEIEVVVRPF